MVALGPVRSVLRPVAAAIRLATKRRRLRIRCAASRPLWVELGAAGVGEPGWVLTNIDVLDITSERDWRRLFAPGSIDALLAEHVWEHLDLEDGRRAARNCFAFLRPGGYLRAAVPDGLHPAPEYREMVKPGGTGLGADDHRVLFDYRSFAAIFTDCGFRVELLEHFDETRRFVFRPWSPDAGMVHRSSRYDERNAGGALNYTSVILDAIKERA